ncbi:MAG: malto-oligosyltrehalose synthase [Thermomicrobiales bacterium]
MDVLVGRGILVWRGIAGFGCALAGRLRTLAQDREPIDAACSDRRIVRCQVSGAPHSQRWEHTILTEPTSDRRTAADEPHDLVREVVCVIEAAAARPVPRATYRLQFNHTFTFDDARRIVPYLADLGISHVYASPVFRAAPGSMHGYDVVDYTEINPEIGGRAGLNTLVETLHVHDMGLILDVVPNHMGIANGANTWWQDVLENGEASVHADTFDIDWAPLKRDLRGKVLLPFLGDQYGNVLERGELRLVFADGVFRIDYWDTPLPLDPCTWPLVFHRAEPALLEALAADDLDLLEFESIITALERLPHGDEVAGRDAKFARQREQIVIRHRLESLVTRNDAIRAAVASAVDGLNGIPDDPGSFDDLDALIDAQNWRPAFWRVASEEINYRRFFAINTLAAIRQEALGVFTATHDLLFDLLAEGLVDGVRIDHPDGLWDPRGYFRDLQRGYVLTVLERDFDRRGIEKTPERRERLVAAIDLALTALEADTARPVRWPLWVVAEKILEHGESLPEDWAIAGTVGYEFAQATTGLFVESSSRVAFDTIVKRFTGDAIRFNDLVYEMKMRQLREAFASELNVLVNELSRISGQDRHSRDFTNADFRNVLREIIACFPVYRTYVSCGDEEVSDRDRATIHVAIEQAMRRQGTIDRSVFAYVERVLVQGGERVGPLTNQLCRLAMKVQQLTGPVMAKGLEDTAFYRFNRLVSLNEVGGDPSRFGMPADELHRQNRAHLRRWPASLLASSTHDTKRSEDVRARISVLSEIPAEWRAAINRWTRLNRKHKAKIDGALAPHRADEYLLYQTLIGTWPVGDATAEEWNAWRTRIVDAMVKMTREASRFTTWTNPDEPYETALTSFIGGILDRRRSAAFIADMERFQERIGPAGFTNALAQQVLKLTSPGIPDVYQGTELFDDSLVDPDNRRPVDVQRCVRLLAEGMPDADGTLDPRDSRLKLAITHDLLDVRRGDADLFDRGDYLALATSGRAADHVVAFARVLDGRAIVVVVPRTALAVVGEGGVDWNDTHVLLPASLREMSLRSLFTGEAVMPGDVDGIPAVSVGTILARWPVAVLASHREAAHAGDAQTDD